MSWKDVTWWEYIIGGVLFFFLFGSMRVVSKVMGVSMDDNKDGVISYSEWVRLPFFYLIAFVTVMKAFEISKSFGTVEYVALLSCTFGLQAFLAFLDSKVTNKSSTLSYPDDVPEELRI